MKAMILPELNQPMKLEEVETPEPGPEEALIQVMACGIDTTDLKILDGFGYVPKLPFILGHETAGIVTKVGSQITDFKQGDRVVAYNYFYCGKCPFCRIHREQLCVDMKGVLGILERFGGYAEYTTTPARQLVPVPENIPWPDVAVCSDAGITSVHAVDRAGVKLGETVLVIGIGGVGAITTQLCKASGARVFVVVRSEQRARKALEMGADEVLNSREVDIADSVRQLTGGLGADCVMDCVGAKETLTYGMDSLQHGGRLVLVGYTAERYPLKGEQLDQNELTIIGTRGGRFVDLIKTVRFVAEGRIKSVVTDLYPIEEANEALALLRDGKAMGRVVLLTPEGQRAAGTD